MSERELHPFAHDYLRRLREAGGELPPDRLHDLLSEIEGHLAEAIAPWASDHDALVVLERLGPPGDIVDAEQPRASPAAPADRRGVREWAAVILLPLGGFAFGIGWLLGLILLWSSRLWTTTDKLIGTLIVPGGLATGLTVALVAGGSSSGELCNGMSEGINLATVRHVGQPSMHCVSTGSSSATASALQIALTLALVLGPIVTAVYLARRARINSLTGVPGTV